MATRLDRLLVLLDTGSTPVTRKVAAQQLGDVQKLHPHELHNLLRRVRTLLKSNSWDSRIAAAQAIEAIVKNVPQWSPPPSSIKVEKMEDAFTDQGKFFFSSFDILKVLKNGEPLVGSAGDEFDLEDDSNMEGCSSQEILARQRQILKKRLGLDLIGGEDFGMDNLVDDKDLVVSQSSRKPKLGAIGKKSSFEKSAELMAIEKASISSNRDMSAREKNKALRKAKKLIKQRSKDQQDFVLTSSKSVELPDVPAAKKFRRSASVVIEQPCDSNKVLVDQVTDNVATMDDMEHWPFQNFCADLCNDLFHPAWEVRHGAASGLREIIKIHGNGAGKRKDMSSEQMYKANKEWLEDAALRLLCIFALDQFGDYVSDDVVAPVRETCSQTLGAVLHCMDDDSVSKVLGVLLTLQEQEQWQVRHGGLLGIKYVLALKKDMTRDLLPFILPAIKKGLQDDDVRAVAAATLVPVSQQLVTYLPAEAPVVVSILWDILLDLDDLDASTKSVMALLSSLVSKQSGSLQQQQHDEVLEKGEGLSELVPRLWPFLKHNISAVRLSALETLQTLLEENVSDSERPKAPEWLEPLLGEHLKYLYRRLLFESDQQILDVIQKVWLSTVNKASVASLTSAVKPLIVSWFMLLITPFNSPVDASRGSAPSDTSSYSKGDSTDDPCNDYLGGITADMDVCTKDTIVMRARIAAARAIGTLLTYMETGNGDTNNTVLLIFRVLLDNLSSTSAIQRSVGALVLSEWATMCKTCCCPDPLIDRLNAALEEHFVYDELMPFNQRLQLGANGLIAYFAENDVQLLDGNSNGPFTLDAAVQLAKTMFEEKSKLLSGDALKSSSDLHPSLFSRSHNCSTTNIPFIQIADIKRRSFLVTIGQMKIEYQKRSTRVQCCIAGALVSLRRLPKKLNPVIKPIMEGIKKEENAMMQEMAAKAVANLLSLCANRSPCPNARIIKNLCSFVCCDANKTPSVDLAACGKRDSNLKVDADGNGNDIPECSKMFGILTLWQKQKDALRAVAQKRGRGSRVGSGHSTALGIPSLGSPFPGLDGSSETDEEAMKATLLQTRGGSVALSTIARHCGASLLDQLPSLWDTVFQSVRDSVSRHPLDPQTLSKDSEHVQSLILSLQVLEVIATSLSTTLQQKLNELLQPLLQTLQYPFTSLRHMISRALGVLSQVNTMETMQFVAEKILPLLDTSDNLVSRQGAVEALSLPLLGRMSDQSEDVRLVATNCFATLVRYMPLEAGTPDPPGMPASLIEQKKRERKFLDQLLSNSKLDIYKIPIPIKAELRKYQQDGVNWLAFLNKYKLHGILCDDMGLGKTLQSICIIAGDHLNRTDAYKASGNEDSKPLPSLVVCPPTLTGHWCYEVDKFCDVEHLNPLHYTGAPFERQRLQSRLKHHNLVIASYDIVRNDHNFFLNIHWNYCVLDEGHIIKNSKTKLAKIIRKLKANHRLILSGTPIQNNVLELWSLFDFLMPGFLGTEKQFVAKFGKPILQSRDAKSSSKEQEAGVLAMEALHRQVLPFILRRLKEDVLQDLPPKIIQDYYCELSPLQVKLYEDFAKSRAKKELSTTVQNVTVADESNTGKKKNASHIFQALQYLRKVCNHPALVLNQNHPEYERITQDLKSTKSSLRDVQHSSKLVALKQLLQDCGIGATSDESQSNIMTDPVVSQHRALIFCQLKSMLDIVEKDLLKAQMPSVMYRRLDGNTPAGSRQDIVHRFNNDPSIDCLLLTTHVGGLGLNLTGADTVIFVEHDWNPSRDLQPFSYVLTNCAVFVLYGESDTVTYRIVLSYMNGYVSMCSTEM
eukprot:gene9222-10196_t